MPDIRKEVESLLFASGRAITIKDLSEIINARPKDVETAINLLKQDYDTRDTSLTLIDTGNGWKMNVKEKYVTLVTKIVADTELPFPLLETLSIIAFKAPAMQAEVIRIRGTNAYEHIQQLIDAGFIERIKKGRSFDLGLTPKFFDYFDVEGEKSLKMLLKDVKATEPKKKKLGDLPVVDVPAGEAAPTGPEEVWNPNPAGQVQNAGTPAEVKALEGLQVVAVPEHPHKKQEQFKPDNDFLNSMESRLKDLSNRNDTHDEDDLFRKKEGEEKELTPENALADDEFDAPENQRNKEIFGDAEAPKEETDEESDDSNITDEASEDKVK